MRNNYSWKKFILLVPMALLGILALLVPQMTAGNPQIAENYLLHIYPTISAPLVFMTSLIPISLTEVFVVFVVLTILLWVILFFYRLSKSKEREKLLYRFLLIVVCMFTLNSFSYTLFLGLGYTREPLLNTLKLTTENRSVEELYEVTDWLLQKTSETREQVNEDENGCMSLSTDLSTSFRYANTAIDRAAVTFPLMKGNTVVPKPVFISHLWSYTGITGMYFPFFGEANINIDVPELFLPYTVCHEVAHVRGIAREEDANLVSFLACLASDRVDFQYSGYQYALVYCLDDLYFADTELYSEIYQGIPEGTLRDWDANNAYWVQFEGPIEETSESINDSFLKANQQDSGVRSYSEVTDLIISYYFQYVKGAENAQGNS